jgi:hypothetical protein
MKPAFMFDGKLRASMASVLSLTVLALGMLSLSSAPGALAGSCPNEAIRKTEPYGSALPDCRAYEQVSPVDKNATDAAGRPGYVQSSPDGERVSYYSVVPFPVSVTAPEFPIYLSTRAPAGWSTQGLDAPVEPGGTDEVRGLTASDGEALDFVDAESQEKFLLAPGAEVEHGNVYVRDSATGGYKLLVSRPAEFTYSASTADGSRVLFTSTKEKLVPGVVDELEQPYLYEWNRETGQVSFAGEVSGKAPEAGTVAGSNEAIEGAVNYTENTISENGSRIFFSEKGGEEKLYMREPEAGRTVQLSQGPAQWRAATPTGSKVFYTEAGALYQYDTESATRTAVTQGTADVQGLVGISTDGSYAYFVANEVLASNENSLPGNAERETAKAKEPNLYEWHEGASNPVMFVTRFAPYSAGGKSADLFNWQGYYRPSLGGSERGFKGSRVSADGKTVLISSTASIIKGYTSPGGPSYNNEGKDELYRYDASTGRLSCVSCNLSRTRASFDTYLSENPAEGSSPVANTVNTLTRNLSADGTRVFFQTEEELLPQANAQMNVYEWEREGAGSCGIEEGEIESGGCLYLLSNGQSSSGAYFGDASENGEDVFFFTRQSLVGQDRDANVDVYDAREGGGIGAQNPVPPSPACVGEAACRDSESVSGPVFGAPSSATFSGAGNLAPPPPPPAVVKPKQKPVQCKKPKKPSHGKCTKKPKPKKRAKKSTHHRGSK